jgi:hypothetical protein
MDELIEPHRRQDLAAVDEWERRSLQEAKGKSTTFGMNISETIKANAEKEKERLVEQWAVEMELSERDLSLTHIGPPDQIVNELDPAFVERLSMRAPRSSSLPIQATIHLTREKGCSVELRGDDPSWLRTARDTLSAELERGVPRWAWLRTLPGAALIAGVLYLALVIASWDSFVLRSQATGKPFSFGWRPVLTFALGIIFSGLIGAVMEPGMRSLLLGFEIVPPGATPKSRKVLGIIGSLASALVLGIIVNLITN